MFDFYKDIQNTYSKAEPNTAHIEVASLQKKYGKDRVKIITQNIDDLFARAGCEDVLHLHGKIGHMHCVNCGKIWKSELNPYIACTKCKSVKNVKPYVIMFGEIAENYKIFRTYLRKMLPDDIFIVVGTSGLVIKLDDFYTRNTKG